MRAGEDRAEDADARKMLVREHGEEDAQHERRRHREDHEADRDPQAVAELRRRQDVAVLVEPDPVPVAAERILDEEAEPRGAQERVDDEHTEQEERREQQGHALTVSLVGRVLMGSAPPYRDRTNGDGSGRLCTWWPVARTRWRSVTVPAGTTDGATGRRRPDQVLVTEILDPVHGDGNAAPREVDRFGADAHHDVGADRPGRAGDGTHRRVHHVHSLDPHETIGADRCRPEVHRRGTHEAGDEAIRRSVVDVFGRAELLEAAVVQHGDPVGHRECLDLVVGDVDEGRPELALERDQVGSRLGTELCIEIRERLVHEEHARSAHQRPGERDPLLLAPGELPRLAVEHLGDAEQLGHPLRLAVPRVAVEPERLEREPDVSSHGHVRVQRVALEHHRDVAALGVDVVDDLIADRDRAFVGPFEPGDQSQYGRLAAARRSEEDEELAVDDLE